MSHAKPPAGDALIGHTGFVGGTLDRANWPFAARFNSSNIEMMRGGRFGTVICAGVSAVKWKANREPEADWAGIARLLDVIETVEAERFVLVSTIDVYPRPVGVTEHDIPLRGEGEPYGRHRLEIEYRIAARFPSHQILRLPALFGTGLRKNAIFDLLTGNQVDRINPNGSFQWYPMRRFADDLARVMQAGPRLINIAVAPLRLADIVAAHFPGAAIGSADTPPAFYDMRTRHAGLLGGKDGYHIDAAASLVEIGRYVRDVRQSGGTP